MTEKLDIIIDAIEGKKGIDILALDFNGSSSVFDFTVICTGSSNKNIQAIADGINEKLGKNQLERLSMEGYNEAKWILVDCGDITVNIFDRVTRQEYKLEVLWTDAREILRK